MHIYVSRALKTALVTGVLFAAGATAAHAEVGGTGLDLNAEASVEVVTEATATEDVLVDVDAAIGGTDAHTGTGTDAHTGTGTGEVVTADAEVDLTGDAVNEVVDVDAELLGGDLSEEQAADAADPATVDADVAIGGIDTGAGETDGGAETDGTVIGTDEVVAADAEVDLTGDATNEVVDADAELLGGDLSHEQAADAADPATLDADVAIGAIDTGDSGTGTGTGETGAGTETGVIGIRTDEVVNADVEVDLTGDASNEVVDVDVELLGGDLSEEQAADATDPATVDADVAIGGIDTGTGETGAGTETGVIGIGTDEVVNADAEVDLAGGAANEVVDVDAELLGGDLSEEQAADAADPATVDVDVEIGGTDGGVVGTDDVAAGADDLASADVEVDLTGGDGNEVVDVDGELLGGDLSEEQATDAADPATVDVDLAIGGTDTDSGTGTGNDGTGTGTGTDTDAGTGTDTGTGGVVIVDAEIDFGVDSADKTAGDEAVVSTGGGALGTGVLSAGRIVTVANLTPALTASGGPLPQKSGTEAAALTTGSGSLPATGADGRTLGGLAALLMVAGLALARRFGVQGS